MKNEVKISVIMPFRNAASTLSVSIESVLKQTFREFELILINDGSQDEGRAIAREYRDPRIRLIDLPASGIVLALNTGLSQAKGGYIARMDADDFMHPERLDKQYHFLETHPEVDVLGTCVNYFGDRFANAGFYHYIEWNNQLLNHDQIFINRFVESPLVHPTAMFRSYLITKHGGYREGPFPEDYELWLRMLHEGIRFHKINEYLLDWYDFPNRLSRTDERYQSDAFFRLKTDYLIKWLRICYEKIPPVMIWGTGKSVFMKSKWLVDHRIHIAGYVEVASHKNPVFKGKPVIHYQDIPRDHLILSYVSDRVGRIRIREYLLDNGFREGRDFLMMA